MKADEIEFLSIEENREVVRRVSLEIIGEVKPDETSAAEILIDSALDDFVKGIKPLSSGKDRPGALSGGEDSQTSQYFIAFVISLLADITYGIGIKRLSHLKEKTAVEMRKVAQLIEKILAAQIEKADDRLRYEIKKQGIPRKIKLIVLKNYGIETETAETSLQDINIFALPSQTNAIFNYIVLIIVGVPVCGWLFMPHTATFLLMLAMLFFPLRSFLDTPRKEKKALNLSPPDGSLRELKREAKELARQVGLKTAPQIVISEKDIHIETMGTFRRNYLILDKPTAEYYNDKLSGEDRELIQAALIHELHHFKNRDTWRLKYAEKLFRSCLLIMAWVAIFSLGFAFYFRLPLLILWRLKERPCSRPFPLHCWPYSHFILLAKYWINLKINFQK